MEQKIVSAADIKGKVLLIGVDGEKMGEVTAEDAERKSKDSGLDLDLVSQNDGINICRLMNAGKNQYQHQKKQKHVFKTKTKEVKFGPAISSHDVETKAKHINGFLEKGHHVKITLLLNRRKPEHAKTVEERLSNVLSQISYPYIKENDVKKSDNSCFLCLAPSKKKGI
jgi:translation initiation factor IF-3